MVGKAASDLPDIRLREAIAVYLYGKEYTDEQLRSIAIMGNGVWYRYPDSGTYKRVGNQITISMSGQHGITYQ
jgi:hypothetical protein